jgi:hypothetical protein
MNQVQESNNFILLTTTPLEFVAPWNGQEYKTRPTGQYKKVLGAAKTALFLRTYCVHLSLTEEQINMLEAYLKMNKYQENDNWTIDEKLRFPFFSLDKGEVVNGKKMVYTMELYSLEDYTNVIELAPVKEEKQEMKLEDK